MGARSEEDGSGGDSEEGVGGVVGDASSVWGWWLAWSWRCDRWKADIF